MTVDLPFPRDVQVDDVTLLVLHFLGLACWGEEVGREKCGSSVGNGSGESGERRGEL